jgi:hypothetical protein
MTLTTSRTTSATTVTTTSLTTGQGVEPLLRVQVSFDLDMTLPPVWTEITARVRSLDYQRGRNFELDQFQTGVATIIVDSNDGAFRPENPSGPYYGLLTPLRRVRVVAEYDGTVYPLWAGFVETWEPTAGDHGKDLVTTLHCSDAFKQMRYLDLNGTLPAALTGNRIAAALSGPKGYPVQTASAGLKVIPAATFVAADPVDAAQAATAAEQGYLFCNADGSIQYQDRNYRLLTENANRIVYGDVPGEMPYANAVYNYNDEHLFTEVRVKSSSSSSDMVAPASASTQQRQYGKRTLALTLPTQTSLGDATPNDAWAQTLANVLLSRYQDPGVRLDEITVYPFADTSQWPAILAAPLGGRLLVRQRPDYLKATSASQLTGSTVTTGTSKTTGTAGLLERAVYIERISLSVRPSAPRWIMKLGLSDATTGSYWVLGDTVLSRLGSTTRLGV